jgi:hypothetical protein
MGDAWNVVMVNEEVGGSSTFANLRRSRLVGLETPSAAAGAPAQYLLIITNLIDEQINLSLRVLYCCQLVNRENLVFTACLNNQFESIFAWKIPAAQAVDRNFSLGSRLLQLRYKTVSFLLSHRLVPPI